MPTGLFSPNINATTVLSSGTAAAVGTIALGTGGNAVRIANSGTAIAYIDIALVNTGTASTTTSMPVLIAPAEPVVIPVPAAQLFVPHITAAGSTTLHVTRGNI